MSVVDPKGYYAYLGIAPSATLDDVRAAYHRCAKQCHPDKDPSPSAKARFQAINEAYHTLSNPRLRAAYDSSRWAVGGWQGTRLDPVPWRSAELGARLRAPRIGRSAVFVSVGALGLALIALLFETAPLDTERVLSALEVQRLRSDPTSRPAQPASDIAMAAPASPPDRAASAGLLPAQEARTKV